MTVDVWMQHPTLRFLGQEMFSSLRRWTGGQIPEQELPVEACRYPPELVDYLRGGGRHKVLFGSNWPMIPPAGCLEHLDDLALDDEARELFLDRNARRVFTLAGRAAA